MVDDKIGDNSTATHFLGIHRPPDQDAAGLSFITADVYSTRSCGDEGRSQQIPARQNE